MESLFTVLSERLCRKGVEPAVVPALMRNLSNLFAANPNMSIEELERELLMLGWDEVDLDNVTYQLIIAVFEPDFQLEDLLEDEYPSWPGVPGELQGYS